MRKRSTLQHNRAKRMGGIVAVACTVTIPVATVNAESGLYAGGSLGSATIQAEVADPGSSSVFEFDENDFAWKAFAGYNFDLVVIDLGIEGGYVDLGAPSGDFAGNSIDLDVTGLDVFGVAGIDLGPIGVFAKAGVISWDADATLNGIDEGSEDGNDPAYGVGARFALGTLEIRGEYEYFDLDTVEDVYMLSAGLVFRF
ncbi:MAG: outer membrane beta-barrel protein [Opitutaceae bacterium]